MHVLTSIVFFLKCGILDSGAPSKTLLIPSFMFKCFLPSDLPNICFQLCETGPFEMPSVSLTSLDFILFAQKNVIKSGPCVPKLNTIF